MITKLYANNFRCLVAFEAEFESFGVLCGPNGSGKSSVFDALQLIRNLGTGDGVLGGDRDHDVPYLEFTNWLKSDIQEFELGVTAEGCAFNHVIHIQQAADSEKPRFVKEQATCDGRTLFERNLNGVSFKRRDGTEAGFFPLDWRQAALASMQPEGHLSELAKLQNAMASLLILRPNPRSMERESKAESRRPDLSFSGLTSWYRSLQQDFEWARECYELFSDRTFCRIEVVGIPGIWPD